MSGAHISNSLSQLMMVDNGALTKKGPLECPYNQINLMLRQQETDFWNNDIYVRMSMSSGTLPLCKENTETQLSGLSFPDPFHLPEWCLCPEPKRNAASSDPQADKDAGFLQSHPSNQAVYHTSQLAAEMEKNN